MSFICLAWSVHGRELAADVVIVGWPVVVWVVVVVGLAWYLVGWSMREFEDNQSCLTELLDLIAILQYCNSIKPSTSY
jgi:hypothetical protein